MNREFPFTNIPGGRDLFSLFIEIAKNPFKSVFYLCSDLSEDSTRELRFSLSSIPILRVLLEEVFILVYMSDDLEHKIAWYYKSGWREIKEEYHRAATAYEDNPEWTQWIDDYRNLLGKWESKYNLTAEEVKDVKKIEGFPIPNKMKKDKAISKEARDFLIFIEDRFYKDFSQTSHLSWSSLAWQAPALLGTGVSEEEKESALKKIRSDCAFHATTLILMFFSEMELLLHFKYKEKLAYLWTFIAEYWGYAKELYDLRYQKQLNT